MIYAAPSGSVMAESKAVPTGQLLRMMKLSEKKGKTIVKCEV